MILDKKQARLLAGQGPYRLVACLNRFSGL
jgi:hypothetical protein